MWVRGIAGLALCILGVVWILQGVNVLHGSSMTGHALYAVLGAVAAGLGAVLLASALRTRHRLAQRAGVS
jgi:uncharacterized membrane protein HdeD (DUF308 family)